MLTFLWTFLRLFFKRKLRKAAFSTGVSIIMFGHEHTFSASGAIAFTSNCFISFKPIEIVNGYFSFFCRLFVGHFYFLAPRDPDFVSAALVCLAFSLLAFSSSNNFFLSSLDIFLNIL